MLNISQVILVRTDSNLCRKELTVHWSAPNSLIRSYLQPCTNSMWGDESEAVAPIIWLYQTVDAQKEEFSFPNLITLRRYENTNFIIPMTIQRRWGWGWWGVGWGWGVVGVGWGWWVVGGGVGVGGGGGGVGVGGGVGGCGWGGGLWGVGLGGWGGWNKVTYSFHETEFQSKGYL